MLVFAVVCTVELVINTKGDLVLYFNSMYSPAANTFFAMYTHAGDGIMFVAICLLLVLFIKIRWGILGFMGFAISGLFSQFFKHVVFGPAPRPHKYFEGKVPLEIFDGQTIALFNSFPSGHSTSAFALFTFLALLAWRWHSAVILFFCAAVLAGISRIYLAQHFTEDVFAGGVTGFITMCMLFYLLEERKAAWISKPSLDKPLIRLWNRG